MYTNTPLVRPEKIDTQFKIYQMSSLLVNKMPCSVAINLLIRDNLYSDICIGYIT